MSTELHYANGTLTVTHVKGGWTAAFAKLDQFLAAELAS